MLTRRGMLKKQGSLAWPFAAWIVAMFLLWLAFPIAARLSWCDPPRQEQRAIDSNTGSDQHQGTSNELQRAPLAEQKQPADKKSRAYARYREYLKRSGFCEET